MPSKFFMFTVVRPNRRVPLDLIESALNADLKQINSASMGLQPSHVQALEDIDYRFFLFWRRPLCASARSLAMPLTSEIT